ncbi:hypothetical protein LX36DRAFT_656270 [Colletotrichum falcatum]|nr:hypothetical protein LX36DRAFT_656270 [Colletotrichum falcatum]
MREGAREISHVASDAGDTCPETACLTRRAAFGDHGHCHTDTDRRILLGRDSVLVRWEWASFDRHLWLTPKLPSGRTSGRGKMLGKPGVFAARPFQIQFSAMFHTKALSPSCTRYFSIPLPKPACCAGCASRAGKARVGEKGKADEASESPLRLEPKEALFWPADDGHMPCD